MKIFRKLENLFSAAAFAEAGEFDTARELATEEVPGAGAKTTATRVKRAGKSSKPVTPSSSNA